MILPGVIILPTQTICTVVRGNPSKLIFALVDPPPKWIPLNDPCLQWIRSQPPSTSVGSPEPAPIDSTLKSRHGQRGPKHSGSDLSTWAMKKGAFVVYAIWWGWKINQLCAEMFHKPWNKDPFFKHMFFLGWYSFSMTIWGILIEEWKKQCGRVQHAFLSILTSLHHMNLSHSVHPPTKQILPSLVRGASRIPS